MALKKKTRGCTDNLTKQQRELLNKLNKGYIVRKEPDGHYYIYGPKSSPSVPRDFMRVHGRTVNSLLEKGCLSLEQVQSFVREQRR
jgi:hypothetical protein